MPTAPKIGGKGEPVKNLAAVALGRLGGLKGGKARAAKLSAEDRLRISRMGVRARRRASAKNIGLKANE
jgi:hypothetical protein